MIKHLHDELAELGKGISEPQQGGWVTKTFEPHLKMDLDKFIKDKGYEITANVPSEDKRAPHLPEMKGKDVNYLFVAMKGQEDYFSIIAVEKGPEKNILSISCGAKQIMDGFMKQINEFNGTPHSQQQHKPQHQR